MRRHLNWEHVHLRFMLNVIMYSDAITLARDTFVSSMLVLIAYLLADNRESSNRIKLMQILCAVGIEAL